MRVPAEEDGNGRAGVEMGALELEMIPCSVRSRSFPSPDMDTGLVISLWKESLPTTEVENRLGVGAREGMVVVPAV